MSSAEETLRLTRHRKELGVGVVLEDIQAQQELLKARLSQCEQLITEQRQRLLKARTNYRVLEKLKERRWRQWVYLNDREVEDTAAESYLAKWSREDAENQLAEPA